MQVNAPAGFGIAEITGVEPGNNLHAGELAHCLAEHGVVCVRLDRRLEKPGFEALAELFGPVKMPSAETHDGAEYKYSERLQHIDAGFVLTDDMLEEQGERTYGGLDARRPGLFETWHCDDTFVARPALATVLHARALPPSGGGPTHFMDMRSVWALLDAGTRSQVRNLRVAYAHNNEGVFAGRAAARGPADVLAPVTHPLIRTHPVAGTEALFMDLDRATHVDGMPEDEGRALLQQLQDFAEANAAKAHHNWREADVLVWDNASVQHKAQGNFKLGEPRRFWRHLIAGPVPVGPVPT